STWNLSNYVLGEYRYLNPSSQLGYYSGTAGSLLTGLVYGGTELKGIKWLGSGLRKALGPMHQVARTGKSFYNAGRVAKLGGEGTVMREIAESVKKASPFTTKGMKNVHQLKLPKGGVAKTALKYSDKVASLEKEISDWLGKNTRCILNDAKDPIFLSKDGLRRVRFDFNNSHGLPKHMHIEHKPFKKWRDLTSEHWIFPNDS
ncbi:MAG: hypothetical protein WB791_02660, partial [Waddliaceae bacterium]